MNSSIPSTTECGNGNGQNCFNNVTSQDVNEITAIKKRRRIDRSHITTIPGVPEMYKCDICQKMFRNKKGKCYHDACITGVKPYKCDICEKSFIKRSHFEYHERVHTGYKPFKCLLCDKAFPQRNKLNRHMISHKQEKQFFCQKCDKRYSKKEDLRNHMTIHTGLSQHVCKSCGKSFRISANLIRHMHTHSNARPYVCEFCTKSFKDKSLLIRHKKTHGKDRPFSCAHCSRFFLSKSELSRHLAIHTDIKPFSCTYCHIVFRRKDNLNRHIRHHHAENSSCNDLGKPEKNRCNKDRVGPDNATKSSSSNATELVSSKPIRIIKSKAKKSLKPPEIISLSSNVPTKAQAVNPVDSRNEASQKISLAPEKIQTATTTAIPIPIRRPGELSNAVPVINGPIMTNNRPTDCVQRKKIFTYTEPIPLAEAVVINRRIEEKLYPQSSGPNLHNNYYFFRKHSNMNEPSTTANLGHSLANLGPGDNSEGFNFTNAKPTIINCNKLQIGTVNARELLSHTYSISPASDLLNSTGTGYLRGKNDAVTPKIINRRSSFEKHETEPKSLDFNDRGPFLGIESANSVPTIRINRKMCLQEKRILPTTLSEEMPNN